MCVGSPALMSDLQMSMRILSPELARFPLEIATNSCSNPKHAAVNILVAVTAVVVSLPLARGCESW